MVETMGKRILIVDDEPFLRRILSYMLTGASYEVEFAEDGEKAWERLASGQGHPDLVISDLMMPGISGVDLVRKVREQGWKDLPVLILTARGQEVDETEARGGGANAFMTKPFRSSELLEKVSELLGREEEAADDSGTSDATGTFG